MRGRRADIDADCRQIDNVARCDGRAQRRLVFGRRVKVVEADIVHGDCPA